MSPAGMFVSRKLPCALAITRRTGCDVAMLAPLSGAAVAASITWPTIVPVCARAERACADRARVRRNAWASARDMGWRYPANAATVPRRKHRLHRCAGPRESDQRLPSSDDRFSPLGLRPRLARGNDSFGADVVRVVRARDGQQ